MDIVDVALQYLYTCNDLGFTVFRFCAEKSMDSSRHLNVILNEDTTNLVSGPLAQHQGS
jgi:hypothetical protein